MCSVMQSDGNSFSGDVVSDSFNKTSHGIRTSFYSKYMKANLLRLLL